MLGFRKRSWADLRWLACFVVLSCCFSVFDFVFVCLFVCFFDHVIFVCLGQWSVSFVSKDPVGVCHFSLLESS